MDHASPVIAEFAQLARVDRNYFQGARVMERITRHRARAAVLGHCLSAFIDGDDSHALPRSDAGRFTDAHSRAMSWRYLLSGCEGARWAAWNNYRLAREGFFQNPTAQDTSCTAN